MKALHAAACLFLAAAPGAAALGQTARPAPAAEDDITNRIINLPPPSAYRVDGAKGTVRSDEGVQGGKALRIIVPGKSEQAWTVSVANPIGKPVKAGDKLVLAFWARLAKPAKGATTASLPFNGVQLASAPYTPLFSSGVEIGPEWKLYEVKGKADKDHAGGTLNAALHLATGKHTIDLGPVFVLNMGQ
jgi:hypothetical protein